MAIIEITERYSALAESCCSLSCGGAIDYAKAKEGEFCLDLGSGRGTDVLAMAADVGENGFAYGLDISDGMLEKARKNAAKFDANNVEFIKSELEIIPLEDNKLDLIISNCTLNHAKDKQAVWNEIYRTLKPGGRFVVSDIYSTETVPEEFANDPQAVAECWAGAITKDEYIKVLNKAGFSEIEILEDSAPYPKGNIEVCSFTIKSIK
jgi:ubiquinone/menaquinone biosynthesis C-methylase UbiE